MQQNQRNSLVAENVAKAVIENRAMSCFVPCCCSCPMCVANVPEMLQMSHVCCKCPLRIVTNVPGVLQISPHMLCDKSS